MKLAVQKWAEYKCKELTPVATVVSLRGIFPSPPPIQEVFFLFLLYLHCKCVSAVLEELEIYMIIDIVMVVLFVSALVIQWSR